MNARRQSVQFFIFSSKWQEIANAIGTEMNHGVTILDGHGWYTGHQMKVLCILARKNESVNMFRLIKMICEYVPPDQDDRSPCLRITVECHRCLW